MGMYTELIFGPELKYDTTKIVKSIKRDTIKSNGVSVIDK